MFLDFVNLFFILVGIFSFTFGASLIYQVLKVKYYRYKADVDYVKKADAKILGKDFEKILPYCDKNMIRILKLMNREERREWLKKNSNQIKKLRNG